MDDANLEVAAILVLVAGNDDDDGDAMEENALEHRIPREDSSSSVFMVNIVKVSSRLRLCDIVVFVNLVVNFEFVREFCCGRST